MARWIKGEHMPSFRNVYTHPDTLGITWMPTDEDVEEMRRKDLKRYTRSSRYRALELLHGATFGMSMSSRFVHDVLWANEDPVILAVPNRPRSTRAVVNHAPIPLSRVRVFVSSSSVIPISGWGRSLLRLSRNERILINRRARNSIAN